MRKFLAMAAVFGALVGPAPLVAQAWDAPMFLPPYPGEDIGVYVTKPNNYDWGLEGIWRQEGQLNLGLRGGIASWPGGTDWFLGVETYGGMLRNSELPLDVNWVLGAGASFSGDATWLRIPLGVSVGKRLEGTSIAITPYVLPRVTFDMISVNNATDTQVNFAADVGADLELTPTLKLRVAGTFGDVDSFGAGLAFAFGRSVAVR